MAHPRGAGYTFYLMRPASTGGTLSDTTQNRYYPTVLVGYYLDEPHMITITESAQEYLAELLSKQEDALGVRVFINDPGTPRAETCIAYCREGDMEEGDVEEPFERFTAWFQGRSIPLL